MDDLLRIPLEGQKGWQRRQGSNQLTFHDVRVDEHSNPPLWDKGDSRKLFPLPVNINAYSSAKAFPKASRHSNPTRGLRVIRSCEVAYGRWMKVSYFLTCTPTESPRNLLRLS